MQRFGPFFLSSLSLNYKNENNLVKLTIDPSKLKSELKYELAPSVNEWFPHVFGPINVEAVVAVEEI